MRYKDHYDTFWDILFKRPKLQSYLTNLRDGSTAPYLCPWGIIPFLKGFVKVFKRDIKLKGFRVAFHDWFVGTRRL